MVTVINCDNCNGRGLVSANGASRMCPDCGGNGFIICVEPEEPWSFLDDEGTEFTASDAQGKAFGILLIVIVAAIIIGVLV